MKKILYALTKLIATAIYIPAFCLTLAIGAIFLRLTRVFLPVKTARKLGHRCGQLYGNFLIRLSLSRVVLQGAENIPHNCSNVLYIANHTSYLDIPLLVGFVDGRMQFVARDSLYRVPFLRTWLRALECFEVSRKMTAQELASFDKIAETLAAGAVVVIFPEGTRSENGQIGEFRTSAFRPARKAKSLIVPIEVSGTRNILPRKGIWITPSKVCITVHKPIAFDEFSQKTPAELASSLRNMLSGHE